MVYLYFVLIAIASYLIGTINFSKIIAWNARRKDITKIGSHNPGTMNMLRSFGFGLAFTTFVAEIVKSGLVCLIVKLILPAYGDLVYFFAGFFLMLGNGFPIWSKFKGGKCVACLAGIFLFSSIWYASLGWFVVCFILLIFVDIGSVISFSYIGGLAISYTVYAWVKHIPYAWAVTALIWVMYLIMLAKHHANIGRLFKGKENHVGFKDKLKSFFSKKKEKEEEVVVEDGQTMPENEIVIDDSIPANENDEGSLNDEKSSSESDKES